MSENVLIALIALLGTLVSGWGAIWISRRYSQSDARKREREQEEEKCERVERAFWQCLAHAKHQRQAVVALASMRDNNPTYVLSRLTELAAEPHPYDDLQRQVEGRERSEGTS